MHYTNMSQTIHFSVMCSPITLQIQIKYWVLSWCSGSINQFHHNNVLYTFKVVQMKKLWEQYV